MLFILDYFTTKIIGLRPLILRKCNLFEDLGSIPLKSSIGHYILGAWPRNLRRKRVFVFHEGHSPDIFHFSLHLDFMMSGLRPYVFSLCYVLRRFSGL